MLILTWALDLRYDTDRDGRTIPSDAEIALFELQCPVSLHIWRSGTSLCARDK